MKAKATLFRLTAPSEDEVRHFLSEQEHSGFSYPEVGATAIKLPDRYDIDRNRIQIGRGEAAWRRAVSAVRAWQMFNIPWVRLYWPTAPIQVGTDVAILAHHFGFCSLNACRIVYVVDDDGPTKRFGFAYGTLATHSECGEERFAVEWNRADDTVWYGILAFSRPQKLVAKLGYPASRFLQRRFARASMLAMLQAIGRSSPLD